MHWFLKFIFGIKPYMFSDSSSVHYHEFFTVHTVMVYVIQAQGKQQRVSLWRLWKRPVRTNYVLFMLSQITYLAVVWMSGRHKVFMVCAGCNLISSSPKLSLQYKSFRLQLKCDATRWRTGGEVKGKLANGVGSQCPSHYLGTWCIQHYYCWCAHLGCQ